jgi:hypothetical protein
LRHNLEEQVGLLAVHGQIANLVDDLWGTILVAPFTAISCGGLLVFQQLVHVSVRKAHNDLVGFTIAVIGVLYAVLLAFIEPALGTATR